MLFVKWRFRALTNFHMKFILEISMEFLNVRTLSKEEAGNLVLNFLLVRVYSSSISKKFCPKKDALKLIGRLWTVRNYNFLEFGQKYHFF